MVGTRHSSCRELLVLDSELLLDARVPICVGTYLVMVLVEEKQIRLV